jgi:signal peptidase II
LVLATLLACVGCDQATKSLAKNHLRGQETESLFGDTVRLEYTENPGGFLSLGQSIPIRWRTAIFTIGVTAALAAILAYALIASRPGILEGLALALFCGGGFGNLIDRLLCGGNVRDFLNLGMGPLRTGIFNLADMAIMAGSILLLLSRPRQPHRSPHPKA